VEVRDEKAILISTPVCVRASAGVVLLSARMGEKPRLGVCFGKSKQRWIAFSHFHSSPPSSQQFVSELKRPPNLSSHSPFHYIYTPSSPKMSQSNLNSIAHTHTSFIYHQSSARLERCYFSRTTWRAH